jgi:hypothetical protein
MMNRAGLKFLAGLIGAAMVLLPFTGLDSLPRAVRSQIAAERSALQTAKSQLRNTQEKVTTYLQSEPELFRTIPASQRWPEQLNDASRDLESASRDDSRLTTLEKENRRQDRQSAEALLSHERQLRSTALNHSTDVEKQASHWVDLKRRLPDVLQQMSRDYQAIHAYDFAAASASIQKAEADWPEKKADLENRLSALRANAAQADSLWQSSAVARRQATAAEFAGLDFGTLFAAAETLHATAADLPDKTSALQSLASQLYVSWDKMLVDMRARDGHYDQQIRTVTTRDGKTASDEKWITVSSAAYRSMQNNLGMAVEHKPVGKYDSEAERVAQPAGFAYMAPPGQRNQYGYWEQRNGQDFWVFYGQYALMRDLLFNRDYRPLDRGDWDGYRTQQSRGQTYYGQDSATAAPKYGTQGAATQDRYSGSTFSKSGGFKDSQYATKSGGYRDSKYASPGARTPGGDSAPRSFGSGSRPEERNAVPAPSRPSYRPPSRPAPSYRPPSAPRRFGRR